jgi:hypothetical protein
MSTVAEVFPSDALLWLEFGGQYVGTTTSNNLLDGDMEATGTTAWSVNAGTLAKVSPGRSGTRCMEVSRTSVNCYLYPTTAVPIGTVCRLRGWARGDGSGSPSIFDSVTLLWAGTSSTDWQYYDVTYTATGVLGWYVIGSNGNKIYVDDVYLDYQNARLIDNLAERADAPRVVKCGDGITSTTFPTQLSGRRGVSFDGGDYIDIGNINYIIPTKSFTINCLVNNQNLYGNTVFLAGDYDSSTIKGWFISFTSDNKVTLIMAENASNIFYYGAPTSTKFPNGGGLVSVTYNGSTSNPIMLFYNDGVYLPSSSGKFGTPISTLSGRNSLLGARWNSTTIERQLPANSSIKYFSILPFAASPLQIKNLHRRVLKRINLP